MQNPKKHLFFALSVLFASHSWAQGGKTVRVNQQRIEQRISALAEFGKNPQGGVSRVGFSEADKQGRAYVIGLMKQAGLAITIDAVGNIIGRREGRRADAPAILFGSHIDSVPEGGNYDGPVGSIGAIECAQVLFENEIVTEHPLEVIIFSNEEGGLVGSRGFVGTLSDEALEVVTSSGLTIRDGIDFIGGDHRKLAQAKREKGTVKAYLELHIEQGSFLDEADIDIGVVEGIVGIKWWDVIIEGFANHAGTTPMNRRRDALVSAAEFILAVKRIGTDTPGRQVATVGHIQAEPGAPNVIPGKVVTSLEIRDLSAAKMDSIFAKIEAAAREIAAKNNTPIRFASIDVSAVPTPTDERVRAIIAEAARELGLSYKVMPSGAGHDAQEVAHIAPVGMIFVPSTDGISHSPREFSSAADIANGANVLLQAILKIDRGDLQD